MKPAMLVLPMLWLAACASTGNKAIMASNFSEPLRDGATTQAEVRTLLGEPQHHGELYVSEQLVTVWRYEGTSRTLNVAAFIPLVDLAAGRHTTLKKWVDCYFVDGTLVKTDVQSDIEEKPAPVGTLAVGVVAIAAAAGAAASGPYGYGCSYPGYYGYRGGYYGNPGKLIVNTIPTGGGGSMTTVKWYK